MRNMQRRQFIALLGGATATWPLIAGARQAPMRVSGFLSSGSADDEYFDNFVRAFRLCLRDGGYVEGQNLAIDFGWAEGQYNRLPVLTAELVRRRVAVIFVGGPPPARAAKADNAAIHIVFTIGDDPVKEGLVASINQCRGNATGVNVIAVELEANSAWQRHPPGPRSHP
jgi:putative tryptophan/tyrosine transport system substrate-binding protein